MTIQRTREIFGDKIAHLSDEEILQFIQQTSSLCGSLLDVILKKHLTQNKKNLYD